MEPSHAQARPPSRFAAAGAHWPGWLIDTALAAGTAALIIGLLLLRGGIWQHQASGDLHAHLLPRYVYAGRALIQEHRLPLWDPYDYLGVPFLAQIQASVLYPPIPLLFGFLQPWTALQTLYGFHVFVLALGMLRYFRRHAIGPVPALIGVLATVSATFRGYFLAGVDHPNYLAGLTFVPWALLFTERVIEGRAVRRAIGWLAATMGAVWLTGYPDYALDLVVLLAVTVLLSAGRRAPTAGVLVGIGVALGTALAAGALVPFAEHLGATTRGVEGESWFATWRAAGFGMQVAHVPRAIFDRFGIAATALALWAVVNVGRTPIAWIACTVWTIFAVNPPFSLLYRLPVYSGIRFPFGWSYLTGLFAALLTAQGLSAGLESTRTWARRIALALGVVATAHALAIIVRAPTSLPELKPGGKAFQAPDYGRIDQRAPVFRRLLEHRRDARLVAELERNGGAFLTRGLRSPTGFEPSHPIKLVDDLIHPVGLYDNMGIYVATDWKKIAAQPDLAARVGVGFVAVPPGRDRALVAAGFRQLATLPDGDLVLFRQPIPRVRLVHEVVYAAPEGTLQATVDASRNAASLAVLEADDRIAVEPTTAADAEHVSIVDEAPERVVLEAHVAAPALLVLTDTFFPGWTATVDDVPVPILRTDHAFRGVALAPGDHRVVFRYRPRSVVVGLTISACTLIGVLGLILIPSRSGRGR